jgi:hypothetical protein
MTAPDITTVERDTPPGQIPMRAVAEVLGSMNPEDKRFYSVTTILKSVGSDEGLIYWAADETAKAAVNSRKTLEALLEDEGPEAAIAWLREARYRGKKGERSATSLGSAVHACAEYYVVTGTRPPMGMALGDKLGVVDAELTPYIDCFELFLDKFQPEFTAAEVAVYNATYGYAGTADGWATIQGVPVILDYKSSKKSEDTKGRRKKPRPEVALQLAAYANAEFAAVWRARRLEKYSSRYYLLNDQERALAAPVPETQGGIVVHITDRHLDVYPVEVGQDIYEQFLYCIESARWDNEMSRKVLGAPLALLDRKVA